MSRLTSSLLASLLATSLVALTGCPGSRTAPVNPKLEPAPVTPAVSPVPVAPAPKLTDVERAHIDDLIMAMYVDDIEVRRTAAEELGEIGPDARGALRELIYCASAEGELEEPIASCAHSITQIANGADAHALTALVFEFQVPLDTKERALAALGELGGLATPALAAVYLDACNRAPTATTAGAASHFERTANMALTQLAQSPASARTYLEAEHHGQCGVTGIEELGLIAQR